MLHTHHRLEDPHTLIDYLKLEIYEKEVDTITLHRNNQR